VIIGIVAISQNYAIGRDGKLPWHYSADLKFFKNTTTGNAIVMGATTWASIGRQLPNRLNIVLSRTGNIERPPGVICLASVDEVLSLARYFDRDIFIIGGAKIFAAFADVIEKWIVTHVPEMIEDADVFMPQDFLNDFEALDRIELDDGLLVNTMRRKTLD
jgi:dihydrofolate reductase